MADKEYIERGALMEEINRYVCPFCGRRNGKKRDRYCPSCGAMLK